MLLQYYVFKHFNLSGQQLISTILFVCAAWAQNTESHFSDFVC